MSPATPPDALTAAAADEAGDALLADLERDLRANAHRYHTVPGVPGGRADLENTIRQLRQQRQLHAQLAQDLHRRSRLTEVLRQAHRRKQADALAAARARAGLSRRRLSTLRSRLPSRLSRARRHRTRRSLARAARPGGRRKRPRRPSGDDAAGLSPQFPQSRRQAVAALADHRATPDRKEVAR
jgi:hypothetical protein